MVERTLSRRSLLVPGLLAAAAAFALLHPLRPALGVTAEEAHWLLTAPGLGPALTDAWAGAVGDDRLLRFPVLVIAVVLVMLSAVVTGRSQAPGTVSRGNLFSPGNGPLSPGKRLFAPENGALSQGNRLFSAGNGLFSPGRRIALAAFLVALATAAQAALLFGPLRIGSFAPFAGLAAGASMILLPPTSRAAGVLHLALAAALAPLDPGLAVLPMGAGLGATLGAVFEAAPSPPGRRLFLMRAASAAVMFLLVALLALHPSMTWHERTGTGVAAVLQKVFLTIGAATVCLGVLRRSRSPEGEAEEATTELSCVRSLALIGPIVACTAWLLVPSLRELSLAPLYSLLLITPALAALALAGKPRGYRAAGGTVSWLSLSSMAAVSLLAIVVSREMSAHPLPVGEALAALRASDATLRQVMAGPGLTRGTLERRCSALGLEAVPEPRQERVGMIAVAALKPPLRQRDTLASVLGDRVLDRYGIVAGRGVSLKWSLFRPLGLRIGPGGARPNIALISVDTLRADHLGLYGYTRATSPGLDRWAADALVYDRALSAAPATAPSFSSLMTGRLPIAHGVRKNYDFLDPGNWTLPMILRRAGYETAAFVSSFVLTSGNSGLDIGLDHYDQRLEGRERNREDRPVRLAPSLAGAVVPWLEKRRAAGPPWFLWVHAIDPHGPYTPLAPFRDTFRGGASRALSRSHIPDYQWLGTLDFATYLNAYDSEILQTDRYIREILDTIERLAAPRGTIVIFTADHGEAFGEHGLYFQHSQTLHDEEIHVPLIIKDTGRPRAGRVQGPVSLLDVLPTLLARLEIETDLPLDGETLEAREAAPAGRSVVLSTWRPGEVMACTDRWKLLIGGGRSDHRDARLYDVVSDPGETRPLRPPPLPGTRDPFDDRGTEPSPSSTEAEARDVAQELRSATAALLARDPLSALLEQSLSRQQWDNMHSEAKEELRSLGYLGP